MEWAIGKASYSKGKIYRYEDCKHYKPILEVIFKNSEKMFHDPSSAIHFLDCSNSIFSLYNDETVRSYLMAIEYNDRSFETIFNLLASLMQVLVRQKHYLPHWMKDLVAEGKKWISMFIEGDK